MGGKNFGGKINECGVKSCVFQTDRNEGRKSQEMINLPMIPQMILSAEGLAANITAIWPFIRVRSLVDQ